MASPGVGQLQFLNALFRELLCEFTPRSLAVLGCAAGNGFEHIDPRVTTAITAVDINPEYLAILRSRFAPRLPGLRVVCADVAACELAPASMDLVHCALLFEYVRPGPVMARVATSLRPDGLLSVVLQRPSAGAGNVSDTPYVSLRRLEPVIQLVDPGQLRRLAAAAQLVETRSWTESLPSGKGFFVGLYRQPGGRHEAPGDLRLATDVD